MVAKSRGVQSGEICVKTMRNAVAELYRCILEIKMKAKVGDGCGPSKGASVGAPLKPLADLPLQSKMVSSSLWHSAVLYASITAGYFSTRLQITAMSNCDFKFQTFKLQISFKDSVKFSLYDMLICNN